MTVTIPPQLTQHPNIRYIIVTSDSKKRPIEKKFTTINNYQFDDSFLQYKLINGYNYGVLGGFGNLIVLDVDNLSKFMPVTSLLPRTFTVLSGKKKLPHYYYFINDINYPTSTKFFDWSQDGINRFDAKRNKALAKGKKPPMIPDTLLDVQGRGKFVVGANSVLGFGMKYEIFDPVPIATISYNWLLQTLERNLPPKPDWFDEKYHTEHFTNNQRLKEITLNTSFNENYQASPISFSKLIREQGLTLAKVMRFYHVPMGKNPTECPMHDSKGGRNFHVRNQEGWCCYHCQNKGDMFKLVMLMENVSFMGACKFMCDKMGVKLDYFDKNRNI